jgi:hypothetical protein
VYHVTKEPTFILEAASIYDTPFSFGWHKLQVFTTRSSVTNISQTSTYRVQMTDLRAVECSIQKQSSEQLPMCKSPIQCYMSVCNVINPFKGLTSVAKATFTSMEEASERSARSPLECKQEPQTTTVDDCQ